MLDEINKKSFKRQLAEFCTLKFNYNLGIKCVISSIV